MRVIKNIGSDRVIDEMRQALVSPSSLNMVSPASSLFAFAELGDLLEQGAPTTGDRRQIRDGVLSLAHKRWSQGEPGKVVIEEVRRSAPFRPDVPTAEKPSFIASTEL